jgi:cobalt-zinc-cadmium efflux system protein
MALSQRSPTTKHTYGLKKSSILASLINAVVLLIAVGAIAWEAILRFASPEPTAGTTVIIVAAIGIVINAATALLFLAGRNDDLNIRGAFLHMASDALVSLGVVLAGFAMLATNWLWLDPVVSLVIVVVIAIGTWSLLRDSLNLALDAVPENIDRTAIDKYLRSLPGVTEVHDLHIWAMSTTETAMTVHLVRPQWQLDDALLAEATEELRHHFGVAHVTLQVEAGDPQYACALAAHTS